MGHKNYSKFSERFKKSENKENIESNNEVIEGQMVIEEVFNQVMDEIVGNEQETEVTGVVKGCAKLNVRKEPKTDAAVLCILDKDAEVVIDQNNSTENFYKVCTSSGVEGYCMTKFIEIK